MIASLSEVGTQFNEFTNLSTAPPINFAVIFFSGHFFFFSFCFHSSKFNILLSSLFFDGLDLCFKVSIASNSGLKELFTSQLVAKSAKPSQTRMICQKSPLLIFDLWMSCPQGPPKVAFIINFSAFGWLAPNLKKMLPT